jgi:hypothetical protein
MDLGLNRLKDGSGDCAVVFIHGILSDGERCWKHENGTYWPDLLVSADQSGILSIFVYPYQSDIFSADYDFDDVVDDLRQRLRNARLFARCPLLLPGERGAALRGRPFVPDIPQYLSSTQCAALS